MDVDVNYSPRCHEEEYMDIEVSDSDAMAVKQDVPGTKNDILTFRNLRHQHIL